MLKLRHLTTAAALLPIAACVNHTWAPPPSGSPLTPEQQAAHCRIWARDHGPQIQWYGIAGHAIVVNHQFNDCMFSEGWVATDVRP